MSKYKIKASVITPLTDAGIIDEGGDMVLSVPYRTQAAKERMFRMTWSAASEALQSDNQRAMIALAMTVAMSRKVNGEWAIMDPTIKWFEVLDDSDPVTAKVVGPTDGVEVLARWERSLIKQYCQDTGVPKPNLLGTKEDLQPILDAALAYYGIN